MMINKLEIIEEKKYKISKTIFLVVFILFIAGSWNFIKSLSYGYSDLMVQVKSGLWMIDNHQFIKQDIFSWFENLNWCPHEIGWYFLSGILYKIGGIYSLIIFAIICSSCLVLLFLKENKSSSLFSCVISLLLYLSPCIGILYDIRPHTMSMPLIMFLILKLWGDSSYKNKGITFLVITFIIAWFHGGMIPLIFVIYSVYIAVDFICKKQKGAIKGSAFLPIAFLVSLCNPIGLDIWTYAFKQSQGTDIWQYINEWEPGSPDILRTLLIIVVIISALIKNKISKLNPKSLLKCAYVCMFAIMYFKYVRFGLFFFTILGMIAPPLFDNTLIWLYSKFNFVKKITNNIINDVIINKDCFLSNILLPILSIFMTLLIGISCFFIPYTIPNNDLNDIAELNGYPQKIIQEIKNREYKHILNSYNSGSWLIYNDIKVSQDNRCDPYMEEFSGKNYLLMPLSSSFKDVNEWVNKFKPDAFVFEYTDDECDVSYILDNLPQLKYKLVYTYDAPIITAKKDEDNIRHWRIYEITN